MLVAMTNENKPIILCKNHSREALRELRNDTSFYCPDCGAPLILKIGHQKIPHFAHRSTCPAFGFSEPETPSHLAAKRELYAFFEAGEYDARLEYSFPTIGQRADLAVSGQGKTFAIEFQHSSISPEEFTDRTNGYRSIHVIPFWILSCETISVHPARPIIKLSVSQQLFISYSVSTRQFYLIAFNPHEKQWVLFEHLFPLSKTRFYATVTTVKLHDWPFPYISLRKKEAFPAHFHSLFAYERTKWRQWRLRSGTGARDPLLSAIYQAGLTFQQLPEWIGIPTESALVIREFSAEWQSYLFICSWSHKERGFTMEDWLSELKYRVAQGALSVRIIEGAGLEMLCMELMTILLEKKVIRCTGAMYFMEEEQS